MRISRIYNNNVALAQAYTGEQMVVIGRGLAFGKRKGDMVDPTLIEQTFVPEHGTPDEHLAGSLAKILPPREARSCRSRPVTASAITARIGIRTPVTRKPVMAGVKF